MGARCTAIVPAAGLCVAMLGGCTEPDRWKPSFTPVDSGGGVAVDGLFAELEGEGFRQPRMSWTADGSALRIATPSPANFSQSTYWSVDPVARTYTTLLTWSATGFVAATCYVGTTACDLTLSSRRVIRRSASGDTATILPTTLNGHFVSENGRWFLYTESDEKMRLLDATTGLTKTLAIPDLTKFREVVAVSNDGAEVDVVAAGGTTVTRYNTSDGSSTSWAVPVDPGFSGYTFELQWVGSTLYALVRRESASEVRFIQYPVGGGAAVTLGSLAKGVGFGLWSWRPQAQRMVLELISASDFNPDILDGPVGVRQFELELLHDGVATRVARSGVGWLNMNLSPDGRTMAYGTYAVFMKYLPD